MKRKAVAFVLAALLAAAPVYEGLAEEALIIEESQDESGKQSYEMTTSEERDDREYGEPETEPGELLNAGSEPEPEVPTHEESDLEPEVSTHEESDLEPEVLTHEESAPDPGELPNTGAEPESEVLIQGESERDPGGLPNAGAEPGTEGLMQEESEPETGEALDTESVSEPEALPYEEPEKTALPELADGGLVLAAETVTLQDSGEDEITEVLDGGSGELYHSGRAQDAEQPLFAPYAASEYGNCYGDQLTGNARAIYERMESEFGGKGCAAFTCKLSSPLTFEVTRVHSVSGKTEWNISGNEQYRNEIVQEINAICQSAYDAFTYDHPEVFWLGAASYAWTIRFAGINGTDTGTGTVTQITFTPEEEYAGAASEIGAFQSAVAQAAAALRCGGSETREEKVRKIHNYVCNTLEYEENAAANKRAWSAGGAFLHEHKVVCEGYAKMFRILCGQAGIPCAVVSGTAVNQVGDWEDHMWNCVQMENGNWYLVDTTWDDQTGRTLDTYLLCGSSASGFHASLKIGEERITYGNFSKSPYAQSFTFPDIAGETYDAGARSHTHRWTRTGEIAASCELDGVAFYECSCLAKKQEGINCTGHRFTAYKSNHDATCDRDGTKTAVCDRCAEATDTLPDIGSGGHQYRYVSNQNATVFADGTKTGTCRRCGAKKTITESGTKLSPTMHLNVSGTLSLEKGKTSSKVKVSGLARGDRVAGWSSSRPSVVSVKASTGKLTAKKAGTARITVKLKSGLSGSFQVKVFSPQKTASLKSVPKKLTLTKGKKSKLSPVIVPSTSKEKLIYTTSDKKVATVSKKGVITARKAGTAKITVKSGSKKAVVKLTVKKVKTKKISGVAKKLTLKKGKTKKLKAVLVPANSDGKITYRSSNKKVAVVSAKGKITAKKKGTAEITVKSDQVSVKCKVTVK